MSDREQIPLVALYKRATVSKSLLPLCKKSYMSDSLLIRANRSQKRANRSKKWAIRWKKILFLYVFHCFSPFLCPRANRSLSDLFEKQMGEFPTLQKVMKMSFLNDKGIQNKLTKKLLQFYFCHYFSSEFVVKYIFRINIKFQNCWYPLSPISIKKKTDLICTVMVVSVHLGS